MVHTRWKESCILCNKWKPCHVGGAPELPRLASSAAVAFNCPSPKVLHSPVCERLLVAFLRIEINKTAASPLKTGRLRVKHRCLIRKPELKPRGRPREVSVLRTQLQCGAGITKNNTRAPLERTRVKVCLLQSSTRNNT